MTEAATEFLRKHGERSLVSLGCGPLLNRLDNHVRLFTECQLDYYVAIDLVSEVKCDPYHAFTDEKAVYPLLNSYFDGKPERFFQRIKTFPNTAVEELRNIDCGVVVCQRILPFRHWENVIRSMNPKLVLQEDLNGCELQQLCNKLFKRSPRGICCFKLQPFRPLRFIPLEKNIILWRRSDCYPCRIEEEPWWRWFFSCFFNKRSKNCTEGMKECRQNCLGATYGLTP